MLRQLEEVWREAAQERQATRTLQLRQFARQETHAGELTDEDGDKTEHEADVRGLRLHLIEEEHRYLNMSS